MNHEPKCQCAICEAVEGGMTREEAFAEQRYWEYDKLATCGWFTHHISCGDDTSPTGTNTHTHGLAENYNHLDFQIVFPMDGRVAHKLLEIIADRVKEGEKFKANQIVENVAGNGYKVKLVLATEDDRKILRLIIPDKDGNLEPDMLNKLFRQQYGDLVKLSSSGKGK